MSNQESAEERRQRIHNQIEAQRARRPNGYETRCERCRFWEADKRKEGLFDEDQEGECHRYAPRIPQHYTAKALGIIAWAVEEAANVEHDDDFDYRFESRESPYHSWPRICAFEWCGEFQERASVALAPEQDK